MVAPGYSTEPTYTRIFREHTPESELFWNKNYERTAKIIECDGWKVELADRCRTLKPGENFKIHANQYHKIIKGTGSLVVEITEHESDK